MRIKSLKINNILSIADLELTFEDKGLVLIEGWNYDADRSNGAGKTAIGNALSFALYGKMPRNITATEILRKGCKEGYAEVVMETGGVEYTIKRSRPTALTFKVNNIYIKDIY